MLWQGHSNSVTQTAGSLEKSATSWDYVFYAIIRAFIAYSYAYTLFEYFFAYIAIPTSFRYVFCLKSRFLWIFFLSLIFSEDRQLQAAAATG